MLISEEQRNIIEKFVRRNKNYAGNEDLFEDFCSEAFQKSYMIFNSATSVEKLESYLAKVVHTSILSVLKNSGRVRRVSSGYIPTNEVKIADLKPADTEKVRIVAPEFVLDFPDPKDTVEEVMITKDCLQRIVDAVCVIHKELPGRLFYDLFYFRYVRNMKQNEIAEKLNISQAEVSKRLLKLSKLISNLMDADGNRV